MTTRFIRGSNPHEPPRCECGHKASMHNQKTLHSPLEWCAVGKVGLWGRMKRCACEKYEPRKA